MGGKEQVCKGKRMYGTLGIKFLLNYVLNLCVYLLFVNRHRWFNTFIDCFLQFNIKGSSIKVSHVVNKIFFCYFEFRFRNWLFCQ